MPRVHKGTSVISWQKKNPIFKPAGDKAGKKGKEKKKLCAKDKLISERLNLAKT